MSTRPDYVDFDSKSRDELLSQIGTFTPVERTVFARLCEAWQPEIDAQHFLGTASAADQESAALRRLMAKLRSAQLGLLTTRATQSGLAPDKIILTSRGSIDFWREAIADETIVPSSEARLTLPSEERLAERKLVPPGYHLTDIDSTTLALAHTGGADESPVYRLRLLDDFKIVFAARSTKFLVNQAFATLRRDVEERGILEELARLRDTSLTEMRAQLKSKSPDVWLENARTLVKERTTIAYRKSIQTTDELFQMAYLVMIFVDARIGLAKQSQEDHAVVTERIKALVKLVADAPQGTVTQQRLEQIVSEAEDQLGPQSRVFRAELDEKVFTPRARRTLPVISLMSGVYIHQDRLAGLFEQAIAEVRGRLMEEYAQLLEAFLRGRDSDITEILGSRPRLDSDIQDRTERIHPLLGEILSRPQALAEAIVREAKRTGTVDSPEDLKRALSRYFRVEDSKLKPLQEILNIDVTAAFDQAYARISVIRQLLLRITGKHESLRSSFENRFSRSRQRVSFGEPRRHTTGEAVRRGAAGRHPSGEAPAAKGSRSDRKRSRTTPQPPAKPKPKSSQEIESLWKEFGDALNTRHEK